MTFRTMLLTAAVVAPLVFHSTPVAAQQQRGQDRAAVASTQSQPAANGNGQEQRQQEAPPGLMRRFAAGLIDMLPDGIVRRFGGAETEPAPEPAPQPAPEPEPEPEPAPTECVPTFGYQNGVPGTFCGDVFTPLGGFPG